MEVATSSDQAYGSAAFSPNLFVEVDEEQVRRKLAAMEEYSTEHDPGRRPQDLELRLRHRGLQIGVEFAEAFVVSRDFVQ
jgi:hypothetical protein